MVQAFMADDLGLSSYGTKAELASKIASTLMQPVNTVTADINDVARPVVKRLRGSYNFTITCKGRAHVIACRCLGCVINLEPTNSEPA